MTELEELKLAYAECSRQRNELLNKLKSQAEQPAQQQEPAFYGFMCEEECCVNICYTPSAPGGPNNELPTAYYTSPPAQRKPLPDEEIGKCIDEVNATSQYGHHHFGWHLQFARAIEAAHNIKENT